MSQTRMGGSSVDANVLGVRYGDGSYQTAAAEQNASGMTVAKQVTVFLTSAQLLALSTAPIQLIAAPGNGLYLFPQYFTMEYTFGGIAYHTQSNKGTCYFTYGNPPATSGNQVVVYGWSDPTSGIIAATESSVFLGVGGEGLVPVRLANNAPLMFSAPNALTLGNGTLKITINYSVVPF
jgi:hypothetical protein